MYTFASTSTNHVIFPSKVTSAYIRPATRPCSFTKELWLKIWLNKGWTPICKMGSKYFYYLEAVFMLSFSSFEIKTRYSVTAVATSDICIVNSGWGYSLVSFESRMFRKIVNISYTTNIALLHNNLLHV